MKSQEQQERAERAAATPERILRVAEALFARDGLDDVSVRDITRTAGIGISSVYYHFGSKEGLILAILERRISELSRKRARLVAALGDREHLTTRDVIAILVLPTAEMAADRTGGGADYIRFLGAVVAHQRYAPLVRRVFPFADEERRMLERVAPQLSPGEREFRFALIKSVVNQVFGDRGMGLRIWMAGDPEDATRPLADRLIDFFAAAFPEPAAPPHDRPRS